MILNRQKRETILRQRYAALSQEEKESPGGKDLKQQIGYFATTKLKEIGTSGGSPFIA